MIAGKTSISASPAVAHCIFSHLYTGEKLNMLPDHVRGFKFSVASVGSKNRPRTCIASNSTPPLLKFADCAACVISKLRRKRNKDARRNMQLICFREPESSVAVSVIVPCVWGPKDDPAQVSRFLVTCFPQDDVSSFHDRFVGLFSEFSPQLGKQPDPWPSPVEHSDINIEGRNVLPPFYIHALRVQLPPLLPPLTASIVDNNCFRKVFLQRHRNARWGEVLFADHKSYDHPVIGGALISLVIIDVATLATFKYDSDSKKLCGVCFGRFVSQWGISKLPYKATVFTDNCGSMCHLRDEAHRRDVAHEWLSPKDPFMNMAELAILLIWSAARATCLLGGVSSYYMPYVVTDVLNKFFLGPTTKSRNFRSPAESIFHIQPDVSGIEACGTICIRRKPGKNVAVPNFPVTHHGEPAKLLCQVSVTDSTYVLLVPRGKRYYTVKTRHAQFLPYTRPGGDNHPIGRPIYSQQTDEVVFPHTPLTPPAVLAEPESSLPACVFDPDLSVTSSHKANDSDAVIVSQDSAALPTSHVAPTSSDCAFGDSLVSQGETCDAGHVDPLLMSCNDIPQRASANAADSSTACLDDCSASLDPLLSSSPIPHDTLSCDSSVCADPLLSGMSCDDSYSVGDMGSMSVSSSRAVTTNEMRNIGWKSHQMACANDDTGEVLASLVSATPVFELDVTEFGDSNVVLDQIEQREEQELLRKYNAIVESSPLADAMRVNICFKLAHKTMRKWRRRDPVPKNPDDWVGPIKDMSWARVLASSRCDDAIAAFDKELTHLVDKILTEITPDDARYDHAVANAQPGRFLLDLKRNGKLKARGVQQGHLEDRSIDGVDFNYFSRVADLVSIRCAFFRPDRARRRVMTIDVSHAFLQSHEFGPDEPPRYLKFRNPITKKNMYFLQRGPIYGSGSAPSRWFNLTLSPWLRSLGFVQDDNDNCIFRHFSRDINVCVYVDDTFIDFDASACGLDWFVNVFSQRFEVNDPEYLEVGNPIDFIGMDLHKCEDGHFISMENYIRKMLYVLDMTDCDMFDTPMCENITDFGDITAAEKKFFMTACGCIGWLSCTCRIDVRHAHSRVSQHMACPGRGALRAVRRILGYLRKNPDMCLGQLNCDVEHVDPDNPWSFYVDADHATNNEPQNKRRSQHGAVALLVRTPVFWASHVHSIATAHKLITEAIVALSSAESEIYCVSNGCTHFVDTSFKSEALNIPCPKPMHIHVDNEAAKVFQHNSARKSQLRHVDCRQKWVHHVRDSTLFRAVEVNTKDNCADFLTKIFKNAKDFCRWRDQLMVRRSFCGTVK